MPEPVTKNSKSKTSSEILFGAKGINKKKREAKASRKEDDTISIVSEKTNKSQYKNRASTIECNLCGKLMRSDNLKAHKGGKFCKQK